MTERPSAEEWSFSRVVFAVIEGASESEAVAKGAAAFGQLVDDETQAIDSVQLVDEFETEPAPFLIRRWNELPAAVTTSSESGQRLLKRIQIRMQTDDETIGRAESTPYLYDETGTAIQQPEESDPILQERTPKEWLIPAIGLKRASESEATQSERITTPTRKRLNCRECARLTRHRFQEYETAPSDGWSDQPIWDCDVCGTPRYGPAPKENGSG